MLVKCLVIRKGPQGSLTTREMQLRKYDDACGGAGVPIYERDSADRATDTMNAPSATVLGNCTPIHLRSRPEVLCCILAIPEVY